MAYSLYMHTTPNGKRYVGITCQVPTRRWGAGWGYRECTAFYRAINKYGWDNIRHEVLATGLTKDEAETAERSLISLLRTQDRRYGYNLDSGGHLGSGHSASTRRKISESGKGLRRSEETRRKLSEAKKKRVINLDTGEIFPSATDAANQFGIKYCNIADCCLGRQKTSRGYHWAYYTE